MSIFAKPMAATKPRTVTAGQVAVLYAGVLVVFAIAQLFTFEEFLELTPQFGLPFGEAFGYLLAPLLIVCEVFAIPFLLRMAVSPAFRWLSGALSMLVAVLWFFIAVWIVTTRASVATIGFLGTVGDLTPGWWAVLIAVALTILAAWSVWGLWPTARGHSIKKS